MPTFAEFSKNNLPMSNKNWLKPADIENVPHSIFMAYLDDSNPEFGARIVFSAYNAEIGEFFYSLGHNTTRENFVRHFQPCLMSYENGENHDDIHDYIIHGVRLFSGGKAKFGNKPWLFGNAANYVIPEIDLEIVDGEFRVHKDTPPTQNVIPF